MIPLEALQVLDAIDHKGSFAAAADELHRVPSAITYTIKKLEEQLDITIFDRTKQWARLTPTGKLILEKGREILQSVEQLEIQARQTESGWGKQLRIVIDTILPYESFWPLIQALQKQQPWLDVQVMTESLSGSWEALINNRADLIIGVSGEEPPGGHWHRALIGQLQPVLCCSPKHPASQLPLPINPEKLKHFTHIVISDSARHIAQRSVGMLGIQQTLAVSNLQQKLSAILHSIGVSHLPSYLAEPLIQEDQLIHLQTEYKTTSSPSYMFWKKDNTGKANAWLRQAIIDNNILEPHTLER